MLIIASIAISISRGQGQDIRIRKKRSWRKCGRKRGIDKLMLNYDEKKIRQMLVEAHRKVKAELSCPNCAEKYLKRLTKKNKIKGIAVYEKSGVEKQNIFRTKRYLYLHYHCDTCGFDWYTRKN